MPLIKLTKGEWAIVDDRDFERVSAFSWCYSDRYAVSFTSRTTGQRRRRFMHWFMCNGTGLPPDDGTVVDHLNYDTLDNRRANLEPKSRQANLIHRRRYRNKGDTMKYTGVYSAPNGKFRAEVKHNGRTHCVPGGPFDSQQAAEQARAHVRDTLRGAPCASAGPACWRPQDKQAAVWLAQLRESIAGRLPGAPGRWAARINALQDQVGGGTATPDEVLESGEELVSHAREHDWPTETAAEIAQTIGLVHSYVSARG